MRPSPNRTFRSSTTTSFPCLRTERYGYSRTPQHFQWAVSAYFRVFSYYYVGYILDARRVACCRSGRGCWNERQRRKHNGDRHLKALYAFHVLFTCSSSAVAHMCAVLLAAFSLSSHPPSSPLRARCATSALVSTLARGPDCRRPSRVPEPHEAPWRALWERLRLSSLARSVEAALTSRRSVAAECTLCLSRRSPDVSLDLIGRLFGRALHREALLLLRDHEGVSSIVRALSDSLSVGHSQWVTLSVNLVRTPSPTPVKAVFQ